METRREDELDLEGVLDCVPLPLLVLSPDLVVQWANSAYLQSVGRRRESLLGRALFEAFPAEGQDGEKDTVQASLERARDTGEIDTVSVRYDVADERDGRLRERHWTVSHAAVADGRGRTTLLLQWSQDVTDAVREHGLRQAAQELSDRWRAQARTAEADLEVRGAELSAEQVRGDHLAQQVARLSAVALLLGSVETLEQLEQIAVGGGLEMLGAGGGALVTRSDSGGWRASVHERLGAHVQARYGDLPYESPLPALQAARTGQRVMLPTRAAGLAFEPQMAQVYDDTRQNSWAFLPLLVRGRCLGSLAVSWVEERELATAELAVLEGFAAQCAQALERVRLLRTEREVARETSALAESLQRSLLTSPPTPPGLEVAVRYHPSARGAEVGGDWYDAFVTEAGATLLVVGDVTGHDRHAAAVMGQLRNLLRGLAYDSEDGPASLLSRLDHALAGLAIPSLATAVLARIEPLATPARPSTGSGPAAPAGGEGAVAARPAGPARRALRWSSAGHPPPLLRHGDGSIEVLSRKADLLLGLDPTLERQEHELELAPGDTLVLYTDGLVEVRTDDLDIGIDRLSDVLAEHGARSVEQLCDRLLTAAQLEANDDDIALLVVRVSERSAD